jgi:hypothetical protein
MTVEKVILHAKSLSLFFIPSLMKLLLTFAPSKKVQ